MAGAVTFAVMHSHLAAVADAGAPGPAAKPPRWLTPPDTSAARPHVYQLKRADDGGWTYDASGFSARIARDGTVSFTNHHFSLKPTLFPFAQARAHPAGTPTLEGVVRRALGGPRAPSLPGTAPEAPPDTTPWGSVPYHSPYLPSGTDPHTCEYPNPCFKQAGIPVLLVTMSFDITDEVLRAFGEDPYRYEKGRFLASTLDLRTQLRAQALVAQLRDDVPRLPSNLQDLLHDESRPLAERLSFLRALRNEIDDGTPAGRTAARLVSEALRTAEAGLVDGGRAPER